MYKEEYMTIAKQIDIRSNIKKFFDMAYAGDVIVVPRKDNKNVVILSEDEYNRLSQQNRLTAYASGLEKIADKVSTPEHITDSVKDSNHRKMAMIGNRKDGWNGNGAEAFPEALISKIDAIIDELIIQPEVFPTALGSIQFEYDNSRRDHMEIEIGDSETAEIFLVMYNGEEVFESISATAEAINKKVGEFYG